MHERSCRMYRLSVASSSLEMPSNDESNSGCHGGTGARLHLIWTSWWFIHITILNLVLVQLLSCVQHFATPWTAARQASLSIINSRSLLKLMIIKLVMPSNHLILCHPLLLLSSIFPSTGVFSNWLFVLGGQSVGASASVLPMNIQGSFPLDWLFWSCSPRDSQEFSPAPWFKSIIYLALSLLYGPTLTAYVTTGKTIALTIQIFVDKVMFLLFNILSSFVIAFLPRSKHVLISWLQSPSAVILEPKKRKSVTASMLPLFHLFALKRWDQMPWS